MIKLMRTLGVLLVIGVLAAGCDSVVDSDSALTESDVTIQSENSALASEAEVAAISSPEMGQVVYENTLYLTAFHNETDVDDVTWAVRLSSSESDAECLANTDVVGNVRGNDNDYEWDSDAGTFSANFDISDWEPGQYCFVVSSLEEEPTRLVQWFYIVDEYAKVGGNIDFADYLIYNHEEIDLKALRGRGQLSHAFSGVVGNAGDAGTVGSITVNYRQLGENCTFVPSSMVLDDDAPGIVGTNQELRAVIQTDVEGCSLSGPTTFFALDRDANTPWDRGAVVVRPGGSTDASPYLIDGSVGQMGGDSWVPMERGNNHVGTR